ncbi:MAG: keratin [Oscillatoriaceae cyanobacterium Prado104]|nr:keratin [Oscillatoriaceae cyanobacterium Prado104]
MDSEEIPTQQIIDKLRQTLEPRIGIAQTPLSESGNGNLSLEEDDEDIAILKTGFDIYNIPITSYQRRFGAVVIALRKFVRKLLKPILERQVIYNFANTRVVQTLSIKLQKMQADRENLEKEVRSEFSERFPEVAAKIQAQEAAIATLQAEIEQIKAVQQQQSAILDRITDRLFDRLQ